MVEYSLPSGVISAIEEERRYQEQKHGADPHSPPYGVGAWLTLMRVELREAEEEWCGKHGSEGALAEILQVVALGVACLEAHQIVTRNDLWLKERAQQ